MKRIVLLTLAVLLASTCALWANGGKEAAMDEEVVLTWAFLESNPAIIEGIEAIMADYEAANPNVTVKVETFRDTPSYNQAMQIRLAAGELPDVMFLKSNLHVEYKDEMVDITNEDFVKNNNFVDAYKIDGKVYFVPAVYFTEQALYRKSIIAELGLDIPTTWPEYVDFLKAIKVDGRYIPWALGARDAWTTYPITEVGPALISGDSNYWNDLAKEKTPFGPGTSWYETFDKMAELSEAGVFGDDPLGIGWSEAAALFDAGEAATINAGLWAVTGFENLDDIDAFPVPFRNSTSEDLRVMHFVDHFYGVTKNASNVEAAKDLLAYFFSPETNLRYSNMAQMGAAVDGVTPDIKILQDLKANYDIVPFSWSPEGPAFVEKKNAVQLDYHRYGQEIVAGILDVDDLAAELNASWSDTF